MVTDGNEIYCADQFVIYTNIKSSCCRPEVLRCPMSITPQKKKEVKKTVRFLGPMIL